MVNNNNKRLCSLRSNEKVNMIFINKTARCIYLIWLDFVGERVIYGQLFPNQATPINTFSNHPWICEDTETGDRMLIAGKNVFIPSAEVAPETPDRVVCVTCVCVTCPMYSLRERALQIVRDSINDIEDIESSQIPSTIKDDLKNKYMSKINMLQIYENTRRAS